VFLQSLRPGLAEELGLGAEELRGRNPRLVYCSVGAYGRVGPLSREPGYDALMQAAGGLISMTGEPDRPGVRVGSSLIDQGTGTWAALGILAALLERATSGEGQVVDAAMVDGSAQLMSIFFGIDAMGGWGPRGTNLLDGGAHFYNVYECADGEYVSVASYEPKFYANLLARIGPLGFADLDPAQQMDREQWRALKARFADLFKTRTSAEWVEFFSGHEVCFAPVLSMSQARAHPHNVERQTFVDVSGAPQPAPAPRFSRTPSAVQGPPVAAGADTDTALADWGFTASDVAALKAAGAIA
jgi:alpha-methylacyl-CoA racemase